MANIALWGDGSVGGIPVTVQGIVKDGRMQLVGQGHVDTANVKALLAEWNMSAAIEPFFGLLGDIDATASIGYSSEGYSFALNSPSTTILFRKGSGGSAFLFTFSRSKLSEQGGTLMMLLRAVTDFLGVRALLLYTCSGSGAGIRSLSAHLPASHTVGEEGVEAAVIPAALASADIVFHGLIALQGNVLYDALHSLLGISTLDFYFYKTADSFCGMLTIPRIRTEMLFVDDLKIMVVQSRKAGFLLRVEGVVGFPPLGDDLRFQIGAAASKNGFSLTGGLTSREPISIINDNYKIWELMLYIGYSPGGPQFGFVASLSLKDLQLFAALAYSHPGRLTLLSAAISDVTLSRFLVSVTSVDFGDSLALIDDVIQIRAFDLCDRAPFSSEEKAQYGGFVEKPAKQNDASNAGDDLETNRYLAAQMGLTEYFHGKIRRSGVVDKAGLFAFSSADVELRYFGDGNVGLVDKTKMRHYLIRRDGSIALQSQFFYAMEDISIGSYHVSKGIFACATVEVFGVTIKVLFSLDELTGCVAFAYVPQFDMGFLTISKSNFAPDSADKDKISLPLPENSIVYSFLEKDMDGAIFFMEATSQSVQFYFDGKITLFELITFDTRIFCTQNEASIHARFIILGFLQLSLDLSVGYSDFQNAHFMFYFAVDFSMLEESISQVKQRLEKKIGEIRNSVGDKKNAVNQARGSLQGMHNEINSINSRLQQLNQSWRSKLRNAFEIGWLECKKAGIYATIWVAERALDIAIAALDLVGAVGEGVLHFVNTVIDFAMNIFFLRKVELRAAANAENQMFQVYVEGILLGNEFSIDGVIELNLIQQGKERLVAFFTDMFTSRLDTSLTQGEQAVRKQVVLGEGELLSMDQSVEQNHQDMQENRSDKKKRKLRPAHGSFDAPDQLENMESHQLLLAVQNISELFGDNTAFYQEMTSLLERASFAPNAWQETEVEMLGMTALSGMDDMIYTLDFLDDIPAPAPELLAAAKDSGAPEKLQQALGEYQKAQAITVEARKQIEMLKQQREKLLAGEQATPRRSYTPQMRRMQLMQPVPVEQRVQFQYATDNAIRKCYQQPRASFIHLPYETGVAAPRNQVYYPRMKTD